MRTSLYCALVALFVPHVLGAAAEPALRTEVATIVQGPTERYYFAQARGGAVPDGGDAGVRIVLTMQEIEKKGGHGFHDVYHVESRDLGRTWSAPAKIESLTRRKIGDGTPDERVIGDLCPRYHSKSGKLLGTGKTFTFRGGTTEDRSREQVSYAVFDPQSNAWSELRTVAMPSADHEGLPLLNPNAGCNDRVDLPNGEILLPIRYSKRAAPRDYTTIVARCRFDGETLTYIEHGTELSRAGKRGLYEPSLAAVGGKFYLTLRSDDSAFVATSDDGLHYAPYKEWTFDDGQVLGSYNTQQHWAVHKDRLYLIYTRRGANNDHIMRHRAPLYIAEVDQDKLCVKRATEQILVPENHADLGNFDVVPVSERETWVVVAESLVNGKRHDERNNVYAAKIFWE
ncbi:MAG: exo-alpha-sialidase [Planctomycetaceae bacterium]|nr:exo-alpha-sialidase [Planctomycetaceae bacterium]